MVTGIFLFFKTEMSQLKIDQLAFLDVEIAFSTLIILTFPDPIQYL